MNNAAVNVQVFVWAYVFIYLGVEFLGCGGTVALTPWGTARPFLMWLRHVAFPVATCAGSDVSTSPPVTPVITWLCDCRHPSGIDGVQCIGIVVWVCFSLTASTRIVSIIFFLTWLEGLLGVHTWTSEKGEALFGSPPPLRQPHVYGTSFTLESFPCVGLW